MTEKELVCLSLKDAADRIGELNHAPEKGFLYSGGVHCVADDGGCVGTFGLGAMHWPQCWPEKCKHYDDNRLVDIRE